MPTAHWRPMRADDLDSVVAVAAAAFPDHFERRDCFAERFALFPQGCFALAAGEAVQGYLVAYPWPIGAIPPLDSLLGALPDSRETWYLHDLALLPGLRGQGHARPIVERLAAEARDQGAERIALVSVNASMPFWQGLGFEPVAGDAALARKLESYGAASRYLVREL